MFHDSERATRHDTPVGKLMRHFWHPVCLSAEVEECGSILACKIMHERIIVARTLSGKLMVTNENCPHRGASLKYAIMEQDTIRCPYHGWAFAPDGQCVEQPFEPDDFSENICAKVYPYVEKYGLVFVFLGSGMPPKEPYIDILDRDGTKPVGRRHDPINCNWLTVQENAADSTHTEYLHGMLSLKFAGEDTTGFSGKLQKFGFVKIDNLLVKTWKYGDSSINNGCGFGNILVMPNMLIIETEAHWRVPIDDDNTSIFIVSLVPENETNIEIFQNIGFRNKDGDYDLSSSFGQDAMALETSSGTNKEILAQSDYGVKIFRKEFREWIEIYKKTQESIEKIANNIYCREYKNLMGGFLPSTGIVKGFEKEEDFQFKWDNLNRHEHVEFIVER